MSDHIFYPHPHEIPGLLDGTVSLIVRPVKPQPYYQKGLVGEVQRINGAITHICGGIKLDELVQRCPWQPGDRLIGKEKYQIVRPFTGNIDHDLTNHYVMYYADDNPQYRDKDKWQSPILMPRELSRITLEVEAVWCKRVQSITKEEIRAAGGFMQFAPYFPHKTERTSELHSWFAWAWDKYNKRGLAWAANPYVFGATVRRVKS